MLLDNVFEQKNIIAQTVSKELEKASHEFVHVKKAEGEEEVKYLFGLGISRQLQAITAVLRESVLELSNSIPGTTSKDIMDLNTTVFLPLEPGHVEDITQQNRDGIMPGNATGKG
uniref:Flotillin-like n=1 Tax=Physcomitrium patens TaxID=3218 RepID=A0A7I4DZD0_PHYPA